MSGSLGTPFLLRFGTRLDPHSGPSLEYDAVRQVMTIRVDGIQRDLLDVSEFGPPDTIKTAVDRETSDE
jgi:hypothetical protein